MSQTRRDTDEQKKQPLINPITMEYRSYGTLSTSISFFGDKDKYVKKIDSKFSTFQPSNKILALASAAKTPRIK